MRFKEAITYFGALDHATECRVEAETVAPRAYVTSGCPLVTTRAMRMRGRNDLTPRRATGLWPAHERREGLAQTRTANGRQSQGCGSGKGRGRLRRYAGAVAAGVPTFKAADDAKSPSCRRGRA